MSPTSIASSPGCIQQIRMRGVRTHNLRGIDVDLPAGQLVVMTGVSGSGKSSLAFDTLFAEGQRRYLESVSTHTRSLLSQRPYPDADEISGLPPTVCVDQRSTTAPARTTLAITTEVYDFLRLLYARAGTAHCTECGQAVCSQSVDQIVQRTLQLPERSKLMILSPMVRARRGAHKDILERIARNGFVRARIDGELVDIADAKPLTVSKQHSIDAVIDRIILKEGIEQRLRESIELACRESDGTCVICQMVDQQWVENLHSTRFSCPRCDISFPAPEPRTFSFNSAWGACPTCQGFGVQGVVHDSDDVVTFGKSPCADCGGSRLLPFPSRVTFFDKTIADFTSQTIAAAEQTIATWQLHLRKVIDSGTSTSTSPNAAVNQDTPSMLGEIRLSSEARLVARKTLPDIQRRLQCLIEVGLGYLTLDRATRTLSGGEYQRARLAACLGAGLHGACFVLDEPTAGLHPRDTHRLLKTLQRLRDNGATVVVVEHDSIIMKAADWLVDLGPGAGSDGGYLMYCGPPNGARHIDSPTGRYLSGNLFTTAPDVIQKRQQQLFNDGFDKGSSDAGDPPDPGSTLNPTPATLAPATLAPETLAHDSLDSLKISGASLNNLQEVSVSIPLRRFVCITGVSGSGKSSLIMDTLLPVATAACRMVQRTVNTTDSEASQKKMGRAQQASPLATPESLQESLRQVLHDVRCKSVTGLQHIGRVVSLDSSPIGRSSRSCIVTITDIWNLIRQLFAKTREARARGFSTARFSFNSGDGRCVECKGTGLRNLQMSFLPDAYIPCSACRGKRFNRPTLSIRFNNASVADVLQMRVDEACQFFAGFSRIAQVLETLKQVGLGYLQLGQPSNTYSGGEAQRVRLATELTSDHRQHTLYILDEPTSGLHPADVGRLILMLRKLVDQKHSVIVVEHQTDIMRSSDWIIDVGPDSGACGGRIVAEGPPATIMQSSTTYTAVAMQE